MRNVRHVGVRGAAALLTLLVITPSPVRAAGSAPRPTRLRPQTEAPTPPEPQSEAEQRAKEAFAGLPMVFEENVGQTDARAKYLARGRGYTLFLTGDGAVLSLNSPVATGDASGPPAEKKVSRAAIRLDFSGASSLVRLVGEKALESKSNYMIGSDPTKWQTDVPNFARVRYEGLYPGIDAVYYGADGQMEYDFVVAPGASPDAIRMTVDGADAIAVDETGDLVIEIAGQKIRQRRPSLYQQGTDGERAPVSGGYGTDGSGNVWFDVGGYDPARPLVIDPVLLFSTFLGGSAGGVPSIDQGSAVAINGQFAFVTGSTDATDFPTTGAAYSRLTHGVGDVFVTKLSADGSSLVYSTYLGGGDSDGATDIAVDASGAVYVTGITSSFDFPTTAGAYDTSLNGVFQDAFVTKLNATGSALSYSSFLGGTDSDVANGIALDASGAVYITGETFSANFPTTAGAHDTSFGGLGDAFVTKLNATGSALAYSTFLGGTSYERGNGIAVDGAGMAYMTGPTTSANFPTTVGAFRTSFSGGDTYGDGWVTRLNAAGSGLAYSTYLGGSADDYGSGVVVDGSGAAYVTGYTSSANFPTTAGAFDTTFDGDQNCAFVTKLNAAGSGLMYSTFLGAHGVEGQSIAVDASGAAFVTGTTLTSAYPTTPGALDGSWNGGDDAFVTKLNAAGSALVYSTFLGGSGNDRGSSIAIDASGAAFVTGGTESAGFPTTVGALDQSWNGSSDAFVTKLNAAGSALVYSTYLGGISSGSDERVGDVAVDGAGAIYVAGVTAAINFPTTTGVFQTSANGPSDAFVTKLSANGAALVYSTYVGGSSADDATGLAVDASGAAYAIGNTASADFPTTPGAFDGSLTGDSDMFVMKLNAAGNSLTYSTYLGGSVFFEFGNAIALDTSGAVYVTGRTASADFPTTPGAFDTSLSDLSFDVFVTKLNVAGSGLVYSTFLGSSTDFEEGFGIAVDGSGAAYVTGNTNSPDFPTTAGAFDTTSNGGTDAFVTKLNAAGSALTYSTFLGGSASDLGLDIVVDGPGLAYVTGQTSSANYPTTPGAYATSINGDGDAFVTKLNVAGTALAYSTFLGGSVFESAGDIAVDAAGAAFVVGTTRSADFPTTPGTFDSSLGGQQDAFITKLDSAGSALAHSTLVGGSGAEFGEGIAVSGSGRIYIVGRTSSANFPTTSGAVDTTLSEGYDAFVVQYCLGDHAPPNIQTQPLNQTIQRGQTATLVVAATSPVSFSLTYQWYRGESGFTADPVAGATSPTFVTPPLQSTQRFWVRVTDSCGVFRDSASALVTVNRAPVEATTTLDVVNPADDDDDPPIVSLREAILKANADPGTDTITFTFAAPYTINLTSALPAITEPIVLDGLTQSGSAPGRPVVVLAGPGAGAGQPNCTDDEAAIFDGLHFMSSAAGSVVRGLVVNGFPGDGIELEGGGDAGHQTLIQSCFVGTNAAGTAAVMNGRHGVYLNNSAYAIVGGDRAPDGSLALGALLSGNHCAGVKIKGGLAANNTVVGSNIGPDVTGRFPIGNQIGIDIEGAPNTVVGAAGDDAGRRNVCGFNMGVGAGTSGNINTKLGGTSPPNTVILGTTFTNNGGGAIVGGAPYVLALTSAALSATTLSVAGTATVPANRQYRVQYFTSTTCSGSGGQGEVLIAANVLKQSSPAGVLDLGFSSAATTARPGELVAVTVTGTEGTSNFSSCQIVTGRLSAVAERAGTVTLTGLAVTGPGGAVEQGTPGGGSGGTPGLDRTFAGPRDPDDPDVANDEVVPPDPQAAVGPNHLLAVTNEEIVVASKTDGSVARRVSLDAIWAGLKRMPSENLFAFNPRAVYDALSGRYVVAATANPRAVNSAVLLAVSKTTDPLGQWNVYRYDAEGAEVLWADYPTLGFTKDWIAIQVNMSSIAFANVIVRSEIYLIDKAAAYAGSPGTGQASVLGRATTDGNFGATQMPAQTYDAAASTLWLAQTGAGNQGGVGTIQLFRVTGAVGSEVLAAGPAFTTTSTWNTNQLPFADLAPQLGSARKLQINDTRMQAVVFRNGRVYCAHTILLPAVGPTRAAVQWWEVDPAGAGTLVQRGRIDSGTTTEMEAHPSLAVSASGAMVVGYSRFSMTTFPSAAYRYRVATDAAGTLRGEVVLKAGEAKYDKTLGGSDNRWGNYSSATVDPSDANRFWLLNEYAETPRVGTSTTTDQWGVWWGSLSGAAPVAGADTAGIYVASTGSWFLKNTNGGGAADLVFGFGPAGSGLVALRGDWNGDGIDTPGLYDPATGNFFLKNTSGGGAADIVFTFGAGGASVVPVVGDFDGNGMDTIGIYNRTTAAFFLKNTNAGGGADVVFTFGPGGADVEPLFGDYDGNGTDTVGIYNRTTGSWFLKNTNGGGAADVVFGFGPTGTGVEPLMGDYDGNGADTVGVYIAATGTWFLKNANGGGSADVAFSFGPANVKPLVGDWDGL